MIKKNFIFVILLAALIVLLIVDIAIRFREEYKPYATTAPADMVAETMPANSSPDGDTASPAPANDPFITDKNRDSTVQPTARPAEPSSSEEQAASVVPYKPNSDSATSDIPVVPIIDNDLEKEPIPSIDPEHDYDDGPPAEELPRVFD